MVIGEAVEEEEYRIHVRALSVFLLAFSFFSVYRSNMSQ